MIMIGVSLCNVAQRWSSWLNIAFLWPVRIIALQIGWCGWRALAGPQETTPFIAAIAFFLM
jgi:cytochrome d ubiquinol oxidase subunit II